MSILEQDINRTTSIVYKNQLKKQFMDKLSFVYAVVADKKLPFRVEPGLSIYVAYSMKFILTMNNGAQSTDFLDIPYPYIMDAKTAGHIVTEFLWETWNSWLDDQTKGTTYTIDDIHKISAEYLGVNIVSHLEATNYEMCKRLLRK